MSEQARDRIFSRLNAANRQPLTKGPQAADMPVKTFSQREKIETLKKLMEAMRTEVHVTDAVNWLNKHAPEDSVVHIVMTADTAGKYLRPDLRQFLNTRSYENSDYVVLINRQSFFYRYFYIVEYMLRHKAVHVIEPLAQNTKISAEGGGYG